MVYWQKKEEKMIKVIGVISITTILSFLAISSYADEKKKDCSQIKNLYKKMVCKTNNATSGITSKKTLADVFKSFRKK